MRETKFKAYDKTLKKFWDVELYIDSEGIVYQWAENEAEQWLEETTNFDIVWWTGLKDKNGKEIYEGDIIQWWNKVSPPKMVESTNGGWNPFIDDCTTDHSYHYEVIGNIYENPELLEKES